MLAYGVLVIVCPTYRRFQDKVARGIEVAVAEGIAQHGDYLVITAGEGVPGSTNVLRVVAVGDPLQ